MRAKDFQKIIGAIHDAVSATFDHLGDRFSDVADDMGEDFEPLREFAQRWAKMGAKARRAFVEQLLKSAALVVASAVATKAGISLALQNQKQLRKILLGVADWIGPVGATAKKGKKKLKKKLKKWRK